MDQPTDAEVDNLPPTPIVLPLLWFLMLSLLPVFLEMTTTRLRTRSCWRFTHAGTRTCDLDEKDCIHVLIDTDLKVLKQPLKFSYSLILLFSLIFSYFSYFLLFSLILFNILLFSYSLLFSLILLFFLIFSYSLILLFSLILFNILSFSYSLILLFFYFLLFSPIFSSHLFLGSKRIQKFTLWFRNGCHDG